MTKFIELVFGLIFCIAILLCIVLQGCGQSPPDPKLINKEDATVPPEIKTIKVEKEQRFTVKSYGYFEAGYDNNKREILIVTDTKLQKEYLAITGCGVTEIVHRGKTQGEE